MIEWAHDHGGFAVAAHPRFRGDNTSFSLSEIQDLASAERPERRLSGMETFFAAGVDLRPTLIHTADRLGLTQYGSSDAHKLKRIGRIATVVNDLPEDYTNDDVFAAMALGNAKPVILQPSTDDIEAAKGPFGSYLTLLRGGHDPEEEAHLQEVRTPDERIVA